MHNLNILNFSHNFNQLFVVVLMSIQPVFFQCTWNFSVIDHILVHSIGPGPYQGYISCRGNGEVIGRQSDKGVCGVFGSQWGYIDCCLFSPEICFLPKADVSCFRVQLSPRSCHQSVRCLFSRFMNSFPCRKTNNISMS